MGDLLGADFALAHKDTLYRCLDRLLVHKADLFSFLQQRWKSLFGADFEVLLYDLTSTYFECDPPAGRQAALWLQPGQALGLRAGGHCLDRDTGRLAAGLRGDGWQHRGQDDAARLPQTDRGPVWQGPAHWVMDRGIPTEEVLAEMRAPSRRFSIWWAHRADASRTGAGLPDQAVGAGS